jgi:hypothetical protein
MLRHRLLLALTLGFATQFFVGLAATYLPYSQARDTILDALSIPGALIAGLVYPQGVHTGGGAPYWGLLVRVSNLFVYVLLWYACIQIVAYFRVKQTARSASK